MKGVEYVVAVAFCLLAVGSTLVSMAQEEVPVPQPEGPAFHLGIGAKLQEGRIPFLLAFVRYGAIGVDIGGGVGFEILAGTGVTLFWYDVLGKYYLELQDFLHLYIGGGIIGLQGSVAVPTTGIPISVTISTFGPHLTFGAELRWKNLAVFLGGDWLMLRDIQLTVPGGIGLSVPFAYGGSSYHIGVRYNF